MSRFATTAILGPGAVALALAMLASAPAFAEPYQKEIVECKKGMVYDKKKKRCVKAQSALTPGSLLADNAFPRAAAETSFYPVT